MDVENKVALVTGAVSGIGLEIVKELLKNGAKGITMIDSNEKQGVIKESILRKEFGEERVFYIKADVTNQDEFEDAFKKTIGIYKQLDIVINNAGILNDLNYLLALSVNLGGTMHGTALGVKYMDQSTNGSGGLIINIASIAAFCKNHVYTSPFYAATKAGIVKLSEGFGHRFHVNKTGVRVMVLCPGGTNTPFLRNVKFLDGCLEEIAEKHKEVDLQQADVIGRAVIQMLRNVSSGSVWLIEQNNLYKISDYDILENYKQLVIENV